MEFRTYTKGCLPGADGRYHKVSDEIWFEYMRSVWREEAASRREKELVTGKKTDEEVNGMKCFPRVVSFDSLVEAHGDQDQFRGR